MKKSVLLVAGVCLLSSMAAFADPVTSVNAVGVTKVNLPAGYSMIACPFNAVGGQALSLDEMFATNLPSASAVFIFIPGADYVIYHYEPSIGGWVDDNFDPAGSLQILRGEGFWVFCPSPVANLSLSGEVPSSAVGTNRIDLINGFQLISFAFPQAISIEGSGLVPRASDAVYKFNGGDYVLFHYEPSLGGWVDDNFDPVALTFSPNEPFWYLSTTPGTNVWNQAKTYTWP